VHLLHFVLLLHLFLSFFGILKIFNLVKVLNVLFVHQYLNSVLPDDILYNTFNFYSFQNLNTHIELSKLSYIQQT